MAIIGPPDPYGGQRGSMQQKMQLFVGPHFGSKMLNFGLHELKTLYFPDCRLKAAPQEDKNGLFGFFGGVLGSISM